jgi:tRNA(fMet)-specific endonuclease VapC
MGCATAGEDGSFTQGASSTGLMRFLLDTNVLLHVVNKAKGYELIEQRLVTAPAHSLVVSVITVWEIFRMVEKAKVPSKANKAAIEFLDAFRVIPMTKPGAALGGQIHAGLAKIGKTIGERDSMIAGIALMNDYTLVTDNVGEMQRVAGLRVENWRIL